MSKNILIISTSPRKNGNSERLSDAFMNGASRFNKGVVLWAQLN